MVMLRVVIWMIRGMMSPRTVLVAENLALRQQLRVLHRSIKRPQLRRSGRQFWVWLSWVWQGWQSTLLIVQPDTVIRWHRTGFRWYWRWKSKAGKVGRPTIETEVRNLIRRMSQENPLWGAP